MEFKEYFLKDICYFQEGYVNPKQTISDYFDGEVKWLRANDLQNNYVYNTSRTLTKAGFESAGKSAKLFKPNTIAISKSGTIGRLGILKDYMCGNRAVINIECNSDIVDIKYLYYFLLFNRPYIESLAQGSVQKNLYVFILEKVKIKLPNKDIQKKIVKILNDIDNKIELNNKINFNLSEISQSLYDNFVREHSNIEYCKIKELNPKLETGKRPNGGVNNIDDGIPSVGAESIKGIGYFDYSKTKYITEEYFEKMKKGIVNGYEVLIYKDGGKPGYFMPNFSMFGEGFPYKKCAINEHVFLLDFGNKKFNIFAYYYFNSAELRNTLHVLGSKSAAIPGINQQDVLNLEIPNVKESEFKEILNILELNTEKILKNSKQNYILSQLRDRLLPKFINGEIEIDKIEI